jgi:hypothetical protein
MTNLVGGNTYELTMIKVKFIVTIDEFVEFIIWTPFLVSFKALSIVNKNWYHFKNRFYTYYSTLIGYSKIYTNFEFIKGESIKIVPRLIEMSIFKNIM